MGTEMKLSKAAPIIRGLLAEPSGDENIPYRRVILKSLADEKIYDSANKAVMS